MLALSFTIVVVVPGVTTTLGCVAVEQTYQIQSRKKLHKVDKLIEFYVQQHLVDYTGNFILMRPF